MNYYGRDCFCDRCCNARNESNKKYLELANRGPKYSESEEAFRLRVERTCNSVELAAMQKEQIK